MPFTISMMSISPHWGQPVPWRMLSPNIHTAGHIPCAFACASPPVRRDVSTRKTLPADGVQVAIDSMRPDVQAPDDAFRGTNCTVPPPDICKFWLEVV